MKKYKAISNFIVLSYFDRTHSLTSFHMYCRQIRSHFLLIGLMLFNPSVTQAQSALYNAANNYLKKRADAFMTITGYSLTPDVTAGSLSIRNNDGAILIYR